MHPTLSPVGNLVLALVWAALTAALVWIYPEFRFVPLVAIGFGALAGMFQARAVDANPQAFATATTMREVRNALIATCIGKASIFTAWCCAAVLLAITLMLSRQYIYAGVMAGYASFMFMRELVTFPALRRIERYAPLADP